MNKILVMIMMGAFLTLGSFFPQNGFSDMKEHSKADMDAKMEKMDKKLKLTAEQKDQMRAAMKEKMDKKHQIMEEKHKAMEAVRAEHKAKMKAILNEEQMKKMEKMHDMKGDMKKGCPMCKDGKMCPTCMLKSKEMKKDCPMCKDGKMCEKCKLKKANDMKKHKDGDHKH